MTHLVSSILIGIQNFPFFAIIFTIPFFFIQFIHYHRFNFVRILLNYAMLLYLLCFVSLIIFPLPDLSVANTLSTYNIQAVPFRFVDDFIRENPLVLTDPHTYLIALLHPTVLQVVFNVILTMPFGMFLRYYCGFSCKRTILYTFMLSLLAEISQLTGLFFIYNGSYRLCDVDDLMTNTLGGYFGFMLIHLMEKRMPSIAAFDLKTARTAHKISSNPL